MKIKGHSIIELKNIKTGEVERYEDDNMVTNALSLFLQDCGMLNTSPLLVGNLRNDPIHNLMGGLLLFDTAITESANTVIRPGGIKMIGNGAYEVTANGDDGVTELGSWNYTESGWKSDGKLAMVWDFDQSQANCGENQYIACVCLTSANHGYIGEGNNNPDFASRTTKRGEYAFEGSAQGYALDDNSDELQRIIRVTRADSTVDIIQADNFFYSATYADEHMSQTGKLKVITKEIPLTLLDMRMSYPMGNTEGQSYMPFTETDITLPPAFLTQLGSNTPWLAGRHGNYYYMLAKRFDTLYPLDPGGVVQGVKINCSTMEATGFTITNTLAYQISVNDAYRVMFGSNTVAALVSYRDGDNIQRGGLMFQDLTTNADTTLVDLSDYNII